MTPTKLGTTLAFLFTLGAGGFLLGSGAEADSPKPSQEKSPAKASARDLVRWNQDLTAAREEAAEGDHPLLVFQLLGSLDQEFC